MKRYLAGLVAVLGLLAGCGQEPRGPVEVLGKTYLSKVGTELYFADKENVKFTNIRTGENSTLKYTLAGDVLSVNDATLTLKLRRNGDRFYDAENRFEIAEKTDADKVLVAKFQEEGRRQKEEEKRLSPDGAPTDKAAYIPEASIGDDANDWATWVAVAWNPDAQTDDTRLGAFSRAWNNTKDSFVRQEMKEKELARINEKLKQVRKIEYLALTRKDDRSGVSYSIYFDNGSGYDFDKKSFKLNGEFCGSGMSYSVPSGASFSFSKPKESPFCYLPVAELSMAKQLEAMRAGGQQFKMASTVYVKIAGVDARNNIRLVPIGIDYTLSKETYRASKPEDVVYTFSHWPFK